mmetsp:Transcript_25075/g.80171  ORF Transcript_25075/g.80171 Transcript_25075/m.80171 type:complete len:420 (-) Transcript_25075:277-1536(-)
MIAREVLDAVPDRVEHAVVAPVPPVVGRLATALLARRASAAARGLSGRLPRPLGAVGGPHEVEEGFLAPKHPPLLLQLLDKREEKALLLAVAPAGRLLVVPQQDVDVVPRLSARAAAADELGVPAAGAERLSLPGRRAVAPALARSPRGRLHRTPHLQRLCERDGLLQLVVHAQRVREGRRSRQPLHEPWPPPQLLDGAHVPRRGTRLAPEFVERSVRAACEIDRTHVADADHAVECALLGRVTHAAPRLVLKAPDALGANRGIAAPERCEGGARPCLEQVDNLAGAELADVRLLLQQGDGAGAAAAPNLLTQRPLEPTHHRRSARILERLTVAPLELSVGVVVALAGNLVPLELAQRVHNLRVAADEREPARERQEDLRCGVPALHGGRGRGGCREGAASTPRQPWPLCDTRNVPPVV